MNVTNNPSATRVRQKQQDRRSIDRLYGQLEDVVTLIPPDKAALQDDVLDWLDRADTAPSASLADHIQQRLVEFETEFAMYRTGTDGTDDFPAACEGCDHHPHACPIFTKRVWQTELERLQEALVGAPEREAKQRYRQFAGQVGCQVIPRRIEEWEDQHQDLLAEGRDLRRATLHMLRPADPEERAADAAAEGLDAATGGERR